mmetsp:Transcript_58447/g.142934  ORF Transcript_58447/g.142934 Transcript_58447/m.142934 type:complete len:90 (-) Transcript_58447:167-436(-)
MMILNQQRNADDDEDNEDEYRTTIRNYRTFFHNQRRQREPPSSVCSVSFSPCGGYVAASRADGTVELRSHAPLVAMELVGFGIRRLADV